MPGKGAKMALRVAMATPTTLLLKRLSPRLSAGMRHISWRGGFVGVDAAHNQVHLYYAVLEGILFNLYQCYLRLAEVGGVPMEIRVSGGILNSPLWLQMAADIFGKPMLTSGFANDSTVGAAMVALKAAGIINRIEDCLPEIRHTYQPRVEYHRLYQVRFANYLDYYTSTAASAETNMAGQ